MSTNMSPHNHGGRNHLIGMLIICGVALVALVATGRSLGEAVPVAALLACPLMMIGMMFMMMRAGNSGASDHAQDNTHDGHRPARDEDDPATRGTNAPANPSTLP